MKKFITNVVLPVLGGAFVTGFFIWVIQLASNFRGF